MRYYLKYRRVVDPIVSILCTAATFFSPKWAQVFSPLSISSRENLAFCLIGTSASLLGFVLAASTFLISHIQNPKYDMMRKSKSYYQLSQIVSSSLWRLFFCTISAALILFVKIQYMPLALMFVFAVVVWTLIALATAIWMVLRVYSIPTEI